MTVMSIHRNRLTSSTIDSVVEAAVAAPTPPTAATVGTQAGVAHIDAPPPDRRQRCRSSAVELNHLLMFALIKTRNIPNFIMRELVQELNSCNVHVAAVGCFVDGDVDIHNMQQHLGDGKHRVAAGPLFLGFANLSGDVQHLLKQSSFEHLLCGTAAGEGDRSCCCCCDCVLFNGGNLLVHVTNNNSNNNNTKYQLNVKILQELERLHRSSGVRLGVYVQETDIDPLAAATLTQCVNDYPLRFALGFAWGGTPGAAPVDVVGRSD